MGEYLGGELHIGKQELLKHTDGRTPSSIGNDSGAQSLAVKITSPGKPSPRSALSL
jgi:hypothetical protein